MTTQAICAERATAGTDGSPSDGARAAVATRSNTSTRPQTYAAVWSAFPSSRSETARSPATAVTGTSRRRVNAGRLRHLARSRELPSRQPERQAHLRRSVAGQPKVPRRREGTRTRRRDRRYARALGPRRERCRDREAVLAGDRRDRRAEKLAR